MKTESEMSKVYESELDEQQHYDESLCERCGCCSIEWVACWNCGGEGGRDGDDLMEEDPLWYSPDDFEICHVCQGKGGWSECIGNCDEHGKHNH